MSDYTIARVGELETGMHKARICVICRANIRRGEYKNPVYRTEVWNHFGQPSWRHTCWRCSKKAMNKEYKDIPDKIERLKSCIIQTKKRKKILEKILGKNLEK